MIYRYLILIYILIFISPTILPQNNWSLQSSGITALINSISIVDNNVTWAAGDSGKIIRTTDAGLTWSSVDGGHFGDAIIWNIDALDSNTALLTITPPPFSATFIYKTLNGGASWEQVFSQNGGFINNIHMVNQLYGLAYGDPIGGKWTVIRTTDGGASWNRISTEPASNGPEIGLYFNSLCVTDSLHIWFLGEQRIYKSSNGGFTWSNYETPNFYTSVWFINNSVGMTSSYINAGLSTNAGAFWNQVAIPGGGSYYSLAGSGANDFWYVSHGYIYHTEDFGTSWTSEMVTFDQFFEIEFMTIGQSVIGYAGGANGSIARYEGTISSVNSIQHVSSEYSLGQNYPNPFNPKTTIIYSLPVSGHVSIKVFDVLGREVTELINDHIGAGTHSINFDALNFTSGIYFYQLQSGDFIETKRLVLLK